MKKDFVLKTLLPIAILLGLYSLTRCCRLLLLPVFHDEAIYIRWAGIIREDFANLFIPAIDGKSPLFMWINAITLGLFNEWLLSGRIISVVAGGFTMLGVYLIGGKLFSQTTGFLAALIYLILPFFLIHDRMALADSLMTTLVTWLIYISIKFSLDSKKMPFQEVYLGLIMGLGFLTKTPFLLVIFFPVLALFFFSKYKNRKLCSGLLIAYFIAFGISLPYLLHEPPFRIIGTDKVFHKLQFIDVFISTVKLENNHVASNFREWFDILFSYITWPIMAIFIISIFVMMKSVDKKQIYLFLWFLLPSLVIIMLGTHIYSRYYLFCIPPVALLTGKTLDEIFNKFGDFLSKKGLEKSVLQFCNILFFSRSFVRGSRAETPFGCGPGHSVRKLVFSTFMLSILAQASYIDYQFIMYPEKAPWVQKDSWQYTDSEYSGYGIKEAVDYLSEVAEAGPIAVFFTFTWGTPGDAVYLYLKDHPNVTFYEAWWADSLPLFIENKPFTIYKSKYEKKARGIFRMKDLKDKPVFFFSRDKLSPPKKVLKGNPNLFLVKSFKKLEEGFSFSMFRLDHSKKIYITNEQKKKKI